MRRLVEIILICVLAASHYLMYYPVEGLPVYLLVAVGFSFLTELTVITGKSRNWQILPLAIYAGLGLRYPEMLIFLPMLLYSAFTGWGMGVLILLLLYREHWNAMSLSISAVAIYFSYRSFHFHQFAEKNLRISDDLKEQMISLEKYNLQLTENEVKSREIVRLEERNRIAGELHDYLGHTISSSILQVEALKLTEPEEGKRERLQLLQDTLANGMTDIRRQLHGMYDNSFSLSRKLEELAAGTPGIEISIHNSISGELSFHKKSDIYGIIREALANTIKHSDAKHFTVFLKEQGKNQVILISDDGSKEPTAINRNMGLSGMEDIVQKYGGKLNYYYRQGFHIHVVLAEERQKGGSDAGYIDR